MERLAFKLQSQYKAGWYDMYTHELSHALGLKLPAIILLIDKIIPSEAQDSALKTTMSMLSAESELWTVSVGVCQRIL